MPWSARWRSTRALVQPPGAWLQQAHANRVQLDQLIAERGPHITHTRAKATRAVREGRAA
jgi:hypothetical protein